MEVWSLKIEETFQQYQKPLRIIGVFPFIIKENGLTINKRSLFLSFLIGILLLLGSVSDLIYYTRNDRYPKVLRYLKQILLLSMPVTQIVTVVSLVIHRTSLALIFSTLKCISYKLPGIIAHNSPFFTIFYIVLNLGSLVSFCLVLPTEEHHLTIVLFHVLAFFNTCTLSLYTSTVLIVKFCFQSLDQTLKIKKKIIRNLNILLDCNDLLLNCCDDLNKCFGFLLLFIMTTNFCVLTTQFYTILQMDNGLPDTIGSVIWALFFSTQVLHLAWVTNSTVDKAEEVKGALIRCSYEEANEYSFLNVMLLIQNKPLTFTACGLFDINYRMVCSMAAGITTYIVVIIQMGGK